MCAHSWSCLGQRMVLREHQSRRFPLQLRVAWWVRPEGQCCPSSMGVALGSVLGWSVQRRTSPFPSLPPLLGICFSLLLAFLEAGCVCLAFPHLTTLLQQHPRPPCFFFFGGAGSGRGRSWAPAHSSPVSEAPGLQACSLQCLCCVFFPPMGGWGTCVGLGDFCLKATPSLSPQR